MNRLLLHGARYHVRPAVFVHRDGPHWQGTPDWRADRLSIRIALTLSQRLGVRTEDPVALWMPLGLDWALIERGLWMIGAVSVPLWPEWSVAQVGEVLGEARPRVLFAHDGEALNSLWAGQRLPGSISTVVVLQGDVGETRPLETEQPLGLARPVTYADVLRYGGTLDTPERASWCRANARSIRPESSLSTEYRWENGNLRQDPIDHRGMVRLMKEVGEHDPRRRGRLRVLHGECPDRHSRATLYAGWADGRTRTVFAPTGTLMEQGRPIGADLVIQDSR